MDALTLLELAEKTLALPEGDEQLEAVEDYVERFGRWFEENRERFDGEGFDRGTLERLVASHAEVMSKVQVLLESTSDKLTVLHRKARAIMAYTDILPKKISVSGSRKG
jgi:hypothetical protein